MITINNSEELDNYIKNYIKEHLDIWVQCDNDCGVKVSLWLDNKKIAESDDIISGCYTY